MMPHREREVDALDIVFDPLPPDELRRFVTEGLALYNVGVTGQADWYPVGYFLRSKDREWLGGLLGDVWGGWLHVTHLWVAAPLRRHGYGTLLMRAAEHYAIERGCRAATLETASYEARPFYEKLGYRVFAELDDYPPGHTKYFLRKELTVRGSP
jgi:ribosomal protein S18 acetylase RimI-like enzyme